MNFNWMFLLLREIHEFPFRTNLYPRRFECSFSKVGDRQAGWMEWNGNAVPGQTSSLGWRWRRGDDEVCCCRRVNVVRRSGQLRSATIWEYENERLFCPLWRRPRPYVNAKFTIKNDFFTPCPLPVQRELWSDIWKHESKASIPRVNEWQNIAWDTVIVPPHSPVAIHFGI